MDMNSPARFCAQLLFITSALLPRFVIKFISALMPFQLRYISKTFFQSMSANLEYLAQLFVHFCSCLCSESQELDGQCPEPVLALMRKMWAPRPRDRPSMVCNVGGYATARVPRVCLRTDPFHDCILTLHPHATQPCGCAEMYTQKYHCKYLSPPQMRSLLSNLSTNQKAPSCCHRVQVTHPTITTLLSGGGEEGVGAGCGGQTLRHCQHQRERLREYFLSIFSHRVICPINVNFVIFVTDSIDLFYNIAVIYITIEYSCK